VNMSMQDSSWGLFGLEWKGIGKDCTCFVTSEVFYTSSNNRLLVVFIALSIPLRSLRNFSICVLTLQTGGVPCAINSFYVTALNVTNLRFQKITHIEDESKTVN